MSAPSSREPLDLEALRALCDARTKLRTFTDAMMILAPAMIDEIERLRAELAAAKGEISDRSTQSLNAQWFYESKIAAERRKVERVREHHFEDREGMCDGCRMTWPCPTTRAVADEEKGTV